jgi:hypothetical protein
VIAKSYFTEPPPEEKPAPPPASKSVIFEDLPEEESDEEEEKRPRSMSFLEKPAEEDDDKLSFTDLDEKIEVPAESKVEVPEIDLLAEMEKKAEGDGLVLNL